MIIGIQVNLYGWPYELISEKDMGDGTMQVTFLNAHNSEVKGLLTKSELKTLKDELELN